jgi:Flp pilus assembly pilin Flp
VYRWVQRFYHEQKGSTALEYGLICAFVFLAFAATLPALSKEVVSMFELIKTTWTNAVK